MLNTLLFDKNNSNGPLPEFLNVTSELPINEHRAKMKAMIAQDFEMNSKEQNQIGSSFQIDYRQPSSTELIEGVSMMGRFKRKLNKKPKLSKWGHFYGGENSWRYKKKGKRGGL